MKVNGATISGIFTEFTTRFNAMYKAQAAMHPAFAMEIPSNTAIQVHAWMDSVPGVREWVGPRHIRDVQGVGYSLENKKWEGTIGLLRTDVEDDQIGLYGPKVDMLAYNAAVHPDILFANLLKDNGTCYDGTAFFGTHSWRGNTSVSNTTGAALDETSLNAAIQALIENVATTGANNEAPLIMNPEFQIVHGPALRAKVLELVEAEFNSMGASNINYKIAEPLLIPNLTGTYANYWFVLIKNAPVKPFIFQPRTSGELTQMSDPTDENVFMRDEFLYGWRRRYAAGYGLWQLAYRSTGGN